VPAASAAVRPEKAQRLVDGDRVARREPPPPIVASRILLEASGVTHEPRKKRNRRGQTLLVRLPVALEQNQVSRSEIGW
jgi:hypothetical protein